MALNRKQAEHYADTARIIALAQFGIFGYHGIIHLHTHWYALVWSTVTFVVIEALAGGLLMGGNNEH